MDEEVFCVGAPYDNVGGIGHGNGFALLVVLFILLIIVGTAFCY
ncbi:YjcZ family sporulation protein [Sporolactobacillus sp. THM19-2]|nr:YjcZ family sporulation protein [Sporolactobacillus sp. THM19-2]